MPLKVSDGIGAWVSDFKKSSAPQFDGKSEKERVHMATAAYLNAKKQNNESVEEGAMKRIDYQKKSGEPGSGLKTFKALRKPKDKNNSEVQKAIRIANHPNYKQGNYTGAHKAIEKIKPGLASHPKVADALRRANESTETNEDKNGIIPGIVLRDNRPKHLRGKHIEKIAVGDEKAKERLRKKGLLIKNPNYKEVEKEELTPLAKRRAQAIMMKKPNPVNITRSGIKKAARDVVRTEGIEPVKEEFNFEVDIEGLPKMFMYGKGPGDIKAQLRKIVKQPSMIQGIKRVTDATVKKTFRLKAQGREEEENGEVEEATVNEISQKTIDSYRKKAFKQYKRYQDSPSVNPKKSTTDRYIRRTKGIGSADKRSIARGHHWDDPSTPANNPDLIKHVTLSKKTPHQIRKIKGYELTKNKWAHGGNMNDRRESTKNESIGKTPGDHSYHYLQKAKRLASADGHDYDKLPAYDRTHNKHKDYYDNKAKNESVNMEDAQPPIRNVHHSGRIIGTFQHGRGFKSSRPDEHSSAPKIPNRATIGSKIERIPSAKAKSHALSPEQKRNLETKLNKRMQRRTESVELGESTNWKGSKSVSLTRYAAKQGFGVQLSQLKAMPGERIPVTGVHIKMPLKEIPQLIKGLQNVYKAKAGTQLGDDD
tara:strand:- start:1544 stop:3493 length:1950 start_codon:yes stop_codon:yes gene_type:complete